MQFVAEIWRSGHPVASALIKRPLIGPAFAENSLARPLINCLREIIWNFAIRGSNLVSGYPVAALDKTAIGPRVDKTAIGLALLIN